MDPDPARLWASAVQRAGASDQSLDLACAGGPASRAAAAVTAHCSALIDAAGPACVAVKLQLACFERLGAPGWRALTDVAHHARLAGLLAIADGKRGDVPVTATAYAQSLVGSTPTPFGDVEGLGADAFTANPLLGRDALTPLIEAAQAAAAGVFLLVRTSNWGAADVMDLETRSDEGDRRPAPLWERIALTVSRIDDELGGSGLSDVGAVVGATAPEHLTRMRELMPRAIFLLPGVGAQGVASTTSGPPSSPAGPAAW